MTLDVLDWLCRGAEGGPKQAGRKGNTSEGGRANPRRRSRDRFTGSTRLVAEGEQSSRPVGPGWHMTSIYHHVYLSSRLDYCLADVSR